MISSLNQLMFKRPRLASGVAGGLLGGCGDLAAQQLERLYAVEPDSAATQRSLEPSRTGLVATFTSRIVEILTSTNHYESQLRQKIGRVATFCRQARIPPALQQRVRKHLEHVMLRRRIELSTDALLAERPSLRPLVVDVINLFIHLLSLMRR